MWSFPLIGACPTPEHPTLTGPSGTEAQFSSILRNFACTKFSEVASRGVYALCSGSEREERTEHAEFSRWAGAEHQDRHDEGRARRHVVLGGCHRGAADIPRRRGQIRLGGES